MLKVNSRVHLDMRAIRKLQQAQVTALEQTAEYIHTETVPYVPFDCPTEEEQARGRVGGTLSGPAFWVDVSQAESGTVSLVNSTPYARRLYYHPEYRFDKGEHPDAKGKWFEDFTPGGKRQHEPEKVFAAFYRRLL